MFNQVALVTSDALVTSKCLTNIFICLSNLTLNQILYVFISSYLKPFQNHLLINSLVSFPKLLEVGLYCQPNIFGYDCIGLQPK